MKRFSKREMLTIFTKVPDTLTSLSTAGKTFSLTLPLAQLWLAARYPKTLRGGGKLPSIVYLIIRKTVDKGRKVWYNGENWQI
jgi:hypothetical protein